MTEAQYRARKRYRASEKYKLTRKAWRIKTLQRRREIEKKCCERYRKSEHGKSARAKYRKSDENLASQRRYRNSAGGRLVRRKWRLLNRARRAAYQARRRALAGSSAEAANTYQKLALKTFCHWCSRMLTEINRTVDHVVPLIRGGSHSVENMVACCRRCNASKGVKLYWEWDGELAS